MEANKLKKIIKLLIDEKSTDAEVKLVEKIINIIDVFDDNDKSKMEGLKMLKSNMDLSHLEKIGRDLTEINQPIYTRTCFCGIHPDKECDCEPFNQEKKVGPFDS